MSETVTIPEVVWRQILNDLSFMKKAILPLARSYKQATWVSEKEAVEIAGVGARTLRTLAKGGKLQFTVNAKKRDFHYKRVELESYRQNFTTQTPVEVRNDEKLNQLKKVV
jgi:uncharacterized protein YjhX (UPF0386 family)